MFNALKQKSYFCNFSLHELRVRGYDQNSSGDGAKSDGLLGYGVCDEKSGRYCSEKDGLGGRFWSHCVLWTGGDYDVKTLKQAETFI